MKDKYFKLALRGHSSGKILKIINKYAETIDFFKKCDIIPI